MRRVLVSGVLAVLLLAACSHPSSSGPTGPTGPVLPSPGAVNATQTPLLPTSRFALPQLDGGQFQELLGQLRGTPVIVNIWASWCGPCKAEAPVLRTAARRYGTRIQFLGLDVQDQRAPAQEFIRDFGWSYPSVFDPTNAVHTSLGVVGQPVTLFFDRKGQRVATHAGPITQQALSQAIRSIQH